MEVRVPGGWRAGAIAALSVVTVVAVVLGLVAHFSTTPGSPAAATPTAGAGLTVPGSAAPVLLPVANGGPLPSTAALAKELAPLLRQPALGPHVGAEVVDLATGQSLYGLNAGAAFMPASTAKLLTAAAALTTLGPDYRIRTRVVAGAEAGQIVLVGAGDPTLASQPPAGFVPAPASLPALARATAVALRLRGITVVRLSYDSTLFAAPGTSPSWPAGYLSSGQVAPITALSVDEGRTSAIVEGPAPRVADPASAAAAAFARQLRRYGVTVTGTPGPIKAPPTPAASPSATVGSAQASGAVSAPTSTPAASGDTAGAPGVLPVAGTPLASVVSPRLADLVGWMLAASDNDLAEALAHLTALAKGEPATFAGGVIAVERVLADLGLPKQGLHLDDGSGLSRATLVPPDMLTALLTLAAQSGRPALRPLLTGLAVAGFTGSLANRFDGPTTRTGAGVVRAKTGTLTQVTAMAGIVQDASGRLLGFDFVADRVSPTGTLAAREALDLAASALAGCGCG